MSALGERTFFLRSSEISLLLFFVLFRLGSILSCSKVMLLVPLSVLPWYDGCAFPFPRPNLACTQDFLFEGRMTIAVRKLLSHEAWVFDG